MSTQKNYNYYKTIYKEKRLWQTKIAKVVEKKYGNNVYSVADRTIWDSML